MLANMAKAIELCADLTHLSGKEIIMTDNLILPSRFTQ